MGPALRSFSLLAACRLRWELFLPPCLPPVAKIPCHDGLLSLWSHKPVKSSISRLDHERPLRTEAEEEGFGQSCEVGGGGQGQAALADALILSAWDRESHQLQFPETYSNGDMCAASSVPTSEWRPWEQRHRRRRRLLMDKRHEWLLGCCGVEIAILLPQLFKS
ncbi:hypothetical protein ACRRTK_015805 [Alexandromys fortis]